MGKAWVFVVAGLGALVLLAVFLPQLRLWWLTTRADEVSITYPSADANGFGQQVLDLRIITVLGRDGIPAILKPDFVDADEASIQMEAGERVLGLSINGDHRAYPLNLLSRHEIVNDTVGGVPVAVTW